MLKNIAAADIIHQNNSVKPQNVHTDSRPHQSNSGRAAIIFVVKPYHQRDKVQSTKILFSN